MQVIETVNIFLLTFKRRQAFSEIVHHSVLLTLLEVK